MVAALRNKKGSGADGHEPTRVITVRLPKSLHEALRAEAHDHKTSMNKLCIAKLLQVLEEEGEIVVVSETTQATSCTVQVSEIRPTANPVPSVPTSPNYSEY